MIDFAELPINGIKFEQLIRELFICEGFETYWTGVGSDNARDLIIIEKVVGSLSNFQRKWLVSCKHNAHSQKAVGRNEINNIIDDCKSIGAEGFILACTTYPSSSLVKRLEEIEENQKILTKIWDCITLERKLTRPHTFKILKSFLPKSRLNFEWNIYNTFSPSFWAANYAGYFFYMSSRTSHSFPNLEEIEKIIEQISCINSKLKTLRVDHFIRPRAMYLDNVSNYYMIYIDYLFDIVNKENCKIENIPDTKFLQELITPSVEMHLGDDIGFIEQPAMWDIQINEVHSLSEHYQIDHKDFYEPYIDLFKVGFQRDDSTIIK